MNVTTLTHPYCSEIKRVAFRSSECRHSPLSLSPWHFVLVNVKNRGLGRGFEIFSNNLAYFENTTVCLRSHLQARIINTGIRNSLKFCMARL